MTDGWPDAASRHGINRFQDSLNKTTRAALKGGAQLRREEIKWQKKAPPSTGHIVIPFPFREL